MNSLTHLSTLSIKEVNELSVHDNKTRPHYIGRKLYALTIDTDVVWHLRNEMTTILVTSKRLHHT